MVDKVLHLRQSYHLGSKRMVWYLAPYRDIKISDAGVYRILKRNGLNRLSRGTRLRKSARDYLASTTRKPVRGVSPRELPRLDSA